MKNATFVKGEVTFEGQYFHACMFKNVDMRRVTKSDFVNCYFVTCQIHSQVGNKYVTCNFSGMSVPDDIMTSSKGG